jgi:hypothetical protein
MIIKFPIDGIITKEAVFSVCLFVPVTLLCFGVKNGLLITGVFFSAISDGMFLYTISKIFFSNYERAFILTLKKFAIILSAISIALNSLTYNWLGIYSFVLVPITIIFLLTILAINKILNRKGRRH